MIPTFGKLARGFPVQSQTWLKIVSQRVGRHKEEKEEEEGKRRGQKEPPLTHTPTATKPKQKFQKQISFYYILLTPEYKLSGKHKILSHGGWMRLYSRRLGVGHPLKTQAPFGLFPFQCSQSLGLPFGLWLS